MSSDYCPIPTGRARAHQVAGDQPFFDRSRGLWLPPGFQPQSRWRKNLVLYSWGAATIRLYGGDIRYRLSAIYFEFQNLASPGDPIDVPSYDRGPSSGIGYYQGLASSGDRDFVRAETYAPQYLSSDADLFPDDNQLVLFAIASSVAGFHGKPFDVAHNSTIFGGALVASPDTGDPTQDVIVSRFYLDSDEFQLKSPTSQTGLEWELTCE